MAQGALTHGDRRATETRDLSRFNFDNKVSSWNFSRDSCNFHCVPVTHPCFSCRQYGRNALEIVMKSIVKLDSPLVSPPSNFKGDFFKGINNFCSVASILFILFFVLFEIVLYCSVFFSCRNPEWFNRCWPDKCGGQTWHTDTG